VRQRWGIVKEKWPILPLFDPLQGFSGDQIGAIVNFLARHTTAEVAFARNDVLQRIALLILKQVRRIVIVSVMLVQVAEEVVEALLVWCPDRAFFD
jgi:hypothetical protein